VARAAILLSPEKRHNTPIAWLHASK